jgi:hypothetical protein
MMDFCIGNDILDIGSRRADSKLRRTRDLNELTSPTHFDVPNVTNVCVDIYIALENSPVLMACPFSL